MLPDSPCIDAGDPNPAYNDPEDAADPGWAQWPAQGTLRNDSGCYGGPGAQLLWMETEAVTPEIEPSHPDRYELAQNHPNPFNPTTAIRYQLSTPGEVDLAVYNLAGVIVGTLVDEPQNRGDYEVSFDATGLPSGVYFYRLMVGGELRDTKRMLLVK